jgi:peroxiredoxin
VLALGTPLVFAFARAMADGEQRRRQGPIRALIGDETYERLSRGEKTEENYLGDGLYAPDFTLQDQNGKPWRLREHRGKIVVMNFWTVTCQPCMEEMPSLVTLADIVAKRDDIELVSITADKDWQTVAPVFPPRSKLRVLFDPERKIINGKFGTRLFPETWVIDASGVIRLRVDGGRDWSSALTLEAIERFL